MPSHSTVAIVGGGMTGLSCAQMLQEAGLDVLLLEKDTCGSGASGKSSGFITPDSEIELSSLLENYGAAKAKRLWEFVLSGVKHIQKNIQQHQLDCDYQVEDSLFLAHSKAGLRHVKAEHAARKKLGYKSTLYTQTDLKKILGGAGGFGAVRYPSTFGINPGLYCKALKKHLQKKARILEKTKVQRIEGHTLFTNRGTFTADTIVVCTDRFIPELGALEKEIYHVQTFLGLTKPLPLKTRQALFPSKNMMVWNTQLIYNYFRITGEGRLLVGGGNLCHTYDRCPMQSPKTIEKNIKKFLQHQFPGFNLALESSWPGMLGVSKDLLPILGPDPKNPHVLYVGAASGLPWAAALGIYAAERILKNRRDFDKDFSPQRHFPIGPRLQTLLRTPLTYALSHGIAKYF